MNLEWRILSIRVKTDCMYLLREIRNIKLITIHTNLIPNQSFMQNEENSDILSNANVKVLFDNKQNVQKYLGHKRSVV